MDRYGYGEDKEPSRADSEQVAVVEREGKIGNGSSSRRKAQANQRQPQLLMRVVPLSTMTNGESKNEVGEHITSVCRKDEAVEEEVGIYEINQFCCFYIHPPLSRNWERKEEGEERRGRGERKHVH